MNDLHNLGLSPLNQLVSHVKEAADLHTLKFPSFINVAKLQIGIVADGAMGRPRAYKRVDLRAGWLSIAGDSFPGGAKKVALSGRSYHWLGL